MLYMFIKIVLFAIFCYVMDILVFKYTFKYLREKHGFKWY